MTVEANRPAYPITACSESWGMDILTTIATKMMQGLLSNPCGPIQEDRTNGWGLENTSLNRNKIASISVSLADALIAELNK